jgi:hypothetical protein
MKTKINKYFDNFANIKCISVFYITLYRIERKYFYEKRRSKMGKSKDEEIYEEGVKAGKQGGFIDGFAHSLGKSLNGSREDEIFDKGYTYGAEHKYDHRESDINMFSGGTKGNSYRNEFPRDRDESERPSYDYSDISSSEIDDYYEGLNDSDTNGDEGCYKVESTSPEEDEEAENKRKEEELKKQIIEEKIEKIKDEWSDCKLCLMIYDDDEYPEVRIAAIERLPILKVLSKHQEFKKNMSRLNVAFSGEDHNLRFTALHDKEATVRLAALKYSKNLSQDDIKYLATNDSNPDVKLVAMERLNTRDNQNIFEYIGITYRFDDRVVLAAIEKIMGPCHTIEYLAQGHPNRDVRLAALKKIKDDSSLSSIVKCDKNYEIKEAAIKKIKNLPILKDLAIYSRDKIVRRLAATRLTSMGEGRSVFFPRVIRFINFMKKIRS